MVAQSLRGFIFAEHNQRLRVNWFPTAELRQTLNGFASLLFGDSEVVQRLQIQPQLGARAEEVR